MRVKLPMTFELVSHVIIPFPLHNPHPAKEYSGLLKLLARESNCVKSQSFYSLHIHLMGLCTHNGNDSICSDYDSL